MDRERYLFHPHQEETSKPADPAADESSDVHFDVGELEPTQAPETLPKDATVAQRAEAFHKKNPHVYLAIVSLCRRLRARGFATFGMKMVAEQLRWQYAMKTRGDQFKINNSYTAWYARRVMENEPDLADFFETRESPRCQEK